MHRQDCNNFMVKFSFKNGNNMYKTDICFKN